MLSLQTANDMHLHTALPMCFVKQT